MKRFNTPLILIFLFIVFTNSMAEGQVSISNQSSGNIFNLGIVDSKSNLK